MFFSWSWHTNFFQQHELEEKEEAAARALERQAAMLEAGQELQLQVNHRQYFNQCHGSGRIRIFCLDLNPI